MRNSTIMNKALEEMEFDLLHDDGSHQSFNKVEKISKLPTVVHSQSVIKATLVL